MAWDTSNAIDMSHMFDGCKSLISLNLTSFDTENVISMNSMFQDCSSLTELDLRSFDTSNVTDMTAMFQNCTSLQEIKVTSGLWIIPSECNIELMFVNCGVSDVTYYPAS